MTVSGADFGTTVRLRLTISPGTVGSNALSAQVTDYDTGSVIPATGLRLTFTLPARPEVGASTLKPGVRPMAHSAAAAPTCRWTARGGWRPL